MKLGLMFLILAAAAMEASAYNVDQVIKSLDEAKKQGPRGGSPAYCSTMKGEVQ